MNYGIYEGWIEENPVLPKIAMLTERCDPIIAAAAPAHRLLGRGAKGGNGLIAATARVAERPRA
jgi:hypothetical protein